MNIKTYVDACYFSIQDQQKTNKIIELKQPIKSWYGEGEDSYSEICDIVRSEFFNFSFYDEYGYPIEIQLVLYVGKKSYIEVMVETYDDRIEGLSGDCDPIMTIPNITKIEGKYRILYCNNMYELTITDNFTVIEKIKKQNGKQNLENYDRRKNSYNNAGETQEASDYYNEYDEDGVSYEDY